MGLFNILDPVLDLLFNPILSLPPLVGIAIISLIITLIITFIHKYTTDQKLMKELKEKQKAFQQELKKHKDNPTKLMKVQKEAMQSNMEYMKHSFRPMFFTFIPIIIIFGWLSANFAYLPIEPNQDFSTTIVFNSHSTGNVSISVPDQINLLSEKVQEIQDKSVSWTLNGPIGEYVLFYNYGDEKYSKKLIISEDDYAPNIKRKKGFIDYLYSSSDSFLDKSGSAYQISIDNQKLRPLESTNIPWLKNWGWLGTYIIFSIFLSIFIRKILKVH